MAPGAQKLLICYHHFPVLARHTYLLLKNLIRIFLNGDNLRWTLIWKVLQYKILQEKLKADNKLDCAGKCLWKKKHEYQCNAYEYTHDDHSCNLAIIDFLEDPGPQETAQKFYVEYQQIKNLSMTCRGGMGNYIIIIIFYFIFLAGNQPNEL